MSEKKKILIVDDEPDVVNSLAHFFNLRGFEASGALSGESALERMARERADLILLDIMMPGLKGTEVAQTVREKYPDVKIIVVTGYPAEAEKLAQNPSFESILTKPIRVTELFSLVQETINPASMIAPVPPLKGIPGIVMVIKARILIGAASQNVFVALQEYLVSFVGKGEGYEIAWASSREEITRVMGEFNPDLIIADDEMLGDSDELLQRSRASLVTLKDVIVYNRRMLEGKKKAEIEWIHQAVKAACLKHGLIEVSCVSI